MVPMSTQTVAEVYLLRADEVIKRGTNTFFRALAILIRGRGAKGSANSRRADMPWPA